MIRLCEKKYPKNETQSQVTYDLVGKDPEQSRAFSVKLNNLYDKVTEWEDRRWHLKTKADNTVFLSFYVYTQPR